MHCCFDCIQINAIRIILYNVPLIGHMDWIGHGSAFRSSLWIGLDWVTELMDWIGLDLENLTHIQLGAECGCSTDVSSPSI